VATATTKEDTMARTVYGYFNNFEFSARNPADVVSSYISGADTEWCERAEENGAFERMVDDYVSALQAALPEGIILSGDEITGPYSSCGDKALSEQIRVALTETVDLEEIVKRHDFE
jgi:hypothetical protein